MRCNRRYLIYIEIEEILRESGRWSFLFQRKISFLKSAGDDPWKFFWKKLKIRLALSRVSMMGPFYEKDIESLASLSVREYVILLA